MNPSSASTVGFWNDPPPPGLEDIQEVPKYEPDKVSDRDKIMVEQKYRDRHSYRRRSRSRSYDRSHRSHSRSREKSRRRRSRSRKKHRKSRSRSRGHYRHKSRSVSRSISRDRSSRHKHKEKKRKRSHSRSRKHSRSRSRSRKHHYSKTSRKSYSRSPHSNKNDYSDRDENKDVDDDDNDAENKNAFKNDGSFLELYKKMQEEQQQKAEASKIETPATGGEMKKPMFGKRRGGRVLKTGMVAKSKQGDDELGVEPQDPWSIYLKEVKRYKEACCDDDSKTRPLVK
ncbi:arginine/serine-rich coiled-coil protein 2-like isoform X1 [Onthophagus taurus]|uniref:arginine/serine-rich coiled-coil protein 2-like isoform X1 n=1 Tax=Onthophagus taurus TaxID=166361 RepID=UPI0039BDE7F6